MNIESRNLRDEASQVYLEQVLVFDEMERLRLARQVLCGIFAVSVGVFAAHAYWDKNEGSVKCSNWSRSAPCRWSRWWSLFTFPTARPDKAPRQCDFMPAAVISRRNSEATTNSPSTLALQMITSQPMRFHQGPERLPPFYLA